MRHRLIATAAVAVLLAACTAEPDTPPQVDAPPAADGPTEEPDGPEDADDDVAPEEEVGADLEPPPDPPSADDELPEVPDAPGAFELSPDEVYPNAKALAADIAQVVTTYDRGQPLSDAIAALGFSASDATALAEQAAPLHRDDRWSRGRVLYPQLGGVTETDISVMVVTEQMLGEPDGVRTETRTLDVRLTIAGGVWTFVELADAGGSPPQEVGEIPEPAQRVLDDDRIDLPDSARWDILDGHTDPTLLTVLARAADHASFGVVTLRNGHPENVFGTQRRSDHTRGQAIDIHLVEGTEVIDDRAEGSATFRFVEWLYDQPEVKQIGSPWALDGFGGRSFTDIVHQDHIHVAIDNPRWGQGAVDTRR